MGWFKKVGNQIANVFKKKPAPKKNTPVNNNQKALDEMAKQPPPAPKKAPTPTKAPAPVTPKNSGKVTPKVTPK